MYVLTKMTNYIHVDWNEKYIGLLWLTTIMYLIELDIVPYTWQIDYLCEFYILTSVNKINHSYIWL